MAVEDKKISQLGILLGVDTPADAYIEVYDPNEPVATNQNKRISIAELVIALGVNIPIVEDFTNVDTTITSANFSGKSISQIWLATNGTEPITATSAGATLVGTTITIESLGGNGKVRVIIF